MSNIYYPRNRQEAIESIQRETTSVVAPATPNPINSSDFLKACRFFSLEEREDYKKAFVIGQDGSAHQICAAQMAKNIDQNHESESLFTGYAVSYSGQWIPHTFIVEDDQYIIEPLHELMICYLGIELKGDELKQFITSHS